MIAFTVHKYLWYTRTHWQHVQKGRNVTTVDYHALTENFRTTIIWWFDCHGRNGLQVSRKEGKTSHPHSGAITSKVKLSSFLGSYPISLEVLRRWTVTRNYFMAKIKNLLYFLSRKECHGRKFRFICAQK